MNEYLKDEMHIILQWEDIRVGGDRESKQAAKGQKSQLNYNV